MAKRDMQKKKRKGFTVVELVIVIAVIAILAAVLIPVFSRMIEKARVNADLQTARNMNTLVAIARIDKGGDLETEAELKNAICIENGEEFWDTLEPKSASFGYHFWFDISNQKFVLAKIDGEPVNDPEDQEINVETESSKHVRALFPEVFAGNTGADYEAEVGYSKLADNAFRSKIKLPVNGRSFNYYLIDKGGSVLADAISILDFPPDIDSLSKIEIDPLTGKIIDENPVNRIDEFAARYKLGLEKAYSVASSRKAKNDRSVADVLEDVLRKTIIVTGFGTFEYVNVKDEPTAYFYMPSGVVSIGVNKFIYSMDEEGEISVEHRPDFNVFNNAKLVPNGEEEKFADVIYIDSPVNLKRILTNSFWFYEYENFDTPEKLHNRTGITIKIYCYKNDLWKIVALNSTNANIICLDGEYRIKPGQGDTLQEYDPLTDEWKDLDEKLERDDGVYLATFVDWDGSFLSSYAVDTNIDENAIPIYTGRILADTRTGYKWTGWDPELNTMTEDTTYTATYAPIMDGDINEDIKEKTTKYLFRVGNNNAFNVNLLFNLAGPLYKIGGQNQGNFVPDSNCLYAEFVEGSTSGSVSVAVTNKGGEWKNVQLKFSGKGTGTVQILYISDYGKQNEYRQILASMNLEVVNGYNVSRFEDLYTKVGVRGGTVYIECNDRNNVFLCDIEGRNITSKEADMVGLWAGIDLNNSTWYGNGFTYNTERLKTFTGNGDRPHSALRLKNNCALDNLNVKGKLYKYYGVSITSFSSIDDPFIDFDNILEHTVNSIGFTNYTVEIMGKGNTIINCLLENTAAPLRIIEGEARVINTTLNGGVLGCLVMEQDYTDVEEVEGSGNNIRIIDHAKFDIPCKVVLDNVTTINQPGAAGIGSNYGLGIVITEDAVKGVEVEILEGGLHQYNTLSASDSILSNTENKDWVKKAANAGATNMGIINMCEYVAQDNIIDRRSDKQGYGFKNLDSESFIYTGNTSGSAPAYSSAQGYHFAKYSAGLENTESTDKISEYYYHDFVLYINMEEGSSYDWNIAFFNTSINEDLVSRENYTVKVDGKAVKSQLYTFKGAANIVAEYTWNCYGYNSDMSRYNVAESYFQRVSVNALKEEEIKTISISFDGIKSSKYVISNQNIAVPSEGSNRAPFDFNGEHLYAYRIPLSIKDTDGLPGNLHANSYDVLYPILKGIRIADGISEKYYSEDSDSLPDGISVVCTDEITFEKQFAFANGSPQESKKFYEGLGCCYVTSGVSKPKDSYVQNVIYKYESSNSGLCSSGEKVSVFFFVQYYLEEAQKMSSTIFFEGQKSNIVIHGDKTYFVPAGGNRMQVSSLGNDIYAQVIDVSMSDGTNDNHKNESYDAYFPVFGGKIEITDYSNGGAGATIKYSDAAGTKSMPGVLTAYDPSDYSRSLSDVFKYCGSSDGTAGSNNNLGKLCYVSKNIPNEIHEAAGFFVEYKYTNVLGNNCYYVVYYQIPEQKVNRDTAFVFAKVDGLASGGETKTVTIGDKLYVYPSNGDSNSGVSGVKAQTVKVRMSDRSRSHYKAYYAVFPAFKDVVSIKDYGPMQNNITPTVWDASSQTLPSKTVDGSGCNGSSESLRLVPSNGDEDSFSFIKTDNGDTNTTIYDNYFCFSSNDVTQGTDGYSRNVEFRYEDEAGKNYYFIVKYVFEKQNYVSFKFNGKDGSSVTDSQGHVYWTDKDNSNTVKIDGESKKKVSVDASAVNTSDNTNPHNKDYYMYYQVSSGNTEVVINGAAYNILNAQNLPGTLELLTSTAETEGIQGLVPFVNNKAVAGYNPTYYRCAASALISDTVPMINRKVVCEYTDDLGGKYRYIISYAKDAQYRKGNAKFAFVGADNTEEKLIGSKTYVMPVLTDANKNNFAVLDSGVVAAKATIISKDGKTVHSSPTNDGYSLELPLFGKVLNISDKKDGWDTNLTNDEIGKVLGHGGGTFTAAKYSDNSLVLSGINYNISKGTYDVEYSYKDQLGSTLYFVVRYELADNHTFVKTADFRFGGVALVKVSTGANSYKLQDKNGNEFFEIPLSMTDGKSVSHTDAFGAIFPAFGVQTHSLVIDDVSGGTAIGYSLNSTTPEIFNSKFTVVGGTEQFKYGGSFEGLVKDSTNGLYFKTTALKKAREAWSQDVSYKFTDNAGNTYTYTLRYTALAQGLASETEFNFGSSSKTFKGEILTDAGTKVYVWPDADHGVDSGRKDNNGNTIYAKQVKVKSSDNRSSHTAPYSIYFPVLKGVVSITDYGPNGIDSEAKTISEDAASITTNGVLSATDAANKFKFGNGTVSEAPANVSGVGLAYSADNITAGNAKLNLLVEYCYVDEAGHSFYYLVNYVSDTSHNYISFNFNATAYYDKDGELISSYDGTDFVADNSLVDVGGKLYFTPIGKEYTISSGACSSKTGTCSPLNPVSLSGNTVYAIDVNVSAQQQSGMNANEHTSAYKLTFPVADSKLVVSEYDASGALRNSTVQEGFQGSFEVVSDERGYLSGQSGKVKEFSKSFSQTVECGSWNVTYKYTDVAGGEYYFIVRYNLADSQIWKEIRSASFNANGGSVSPESMTVADGYSITFPTPTRSGYKFDCWTDGSKNYNGGVSYIISGGNKSYAAKWIRTYTVIFDANQGKIDDKDKASYTMDENKALSDYDVPNAIRGNAHFDGWTTIQDDINTLVDMDTYVLSGDNVNRTLYAHWTANYTVSYNDNGGTGGPGSEIVTLGESLKKANIAPSNGVSEFLGWFTEKEGGSKVDNNYKPQDNITVYAHWKLKYKVSYNTNGGSGNAQEQIVDAGKSVTLPEAPSKEGNRFDGWVYGSENKAAGSSYTPSGDISFTAKWVEVWTIEFEAEGGSAVSSIVVDKGCTITLPNSTKSECKLKGWYIKGSGACEDDVDVGEPGKVYTPEDNVKLYAEWVDAYTITFNANGGTNQDGWNSCLVEKKNTPSITLPTPTRNGYEFNGWWTDAANGQLAGKANESYTAEGNITLYAHWRKIVHITYNGNAEGVSGVPSGDNTYIDGSGNLPQGFDLDYNTVKRSGYRFIGWVASPSGSSVIKTEAELRVAIENGTSITLYAYWKKEYTVSFDLAEGSGSFATKIVLDGDSYTIPSTEPTRSGYSFDGWSFGGNSYDKCSKITITSDVKLVAKWNNTKYTVSFKKGENTSCTLPDSITQLINTSVNLSTFEPTGFNTAEWKFIGWFDANGTKISSVSRLKGNMELTAGWNRKYKVVFHQGLDLEDISGFYESGTTVTLPNSPSKDGYEFIGWYTKSSGGTKLTSGVDVNGTPVEVWAQWKKFYTISLNANGGSVSPASVKVDDGETISGLPTPTRSGYTFDGWFTSASGGSEVKNGGSISANMSLYAHWTVNEYPITISCTNATVTINVNGKDLKNTNNSVNVPYDSEVIIEVIYTKDYNKDTTISGVEGAEVGKKFSMPAKEVKVVAKSSDSCFAKGTLITLSDGLQKPIEMLTAEDYVLTWDFFGRKVEVQGLSIIVNHGYGYYNVLHTVYSDGTELATIGEHGIFDYDLNEFVFLTSDNYKEYIGHHFVKYDGNDSYQIVSLIGGYTCDEYTEAYSVTSDINSNVFAENMLTVAPPKDFYCWIKMGDKLAYDTDEFMRDVETYGLYNYEVFKDYVTYDEYVAFNGAYLKIAVDKGLIKFEEIIGLIENYKDYFTK